MKLTITATVTSDDGRAEMSAVGSLGLSTGVYGTDHGVAKQDFLTQAEEIVRTIAENQIPALYDAVLKKSEEEQKDETKEVAKIRAKLKNLRDRRAKQGARKQPDQAEQPEQPEQPELQDQPVQQDQPAEQPETQQEE